MICPVCDTASDERNGSQVAFACRSAYSCAVSLKNGASSDRAGEPPYRATSSLSMSASPAERSGCVLSSTALSAGSWRGSGIGGRAGAAARASSRDSATAGSGRTAVAMRGRG